MKNIKTDRRVNRTRRQLREALLDLIMEKGYDAVTIEEITERADLGRTTFYLHYRDKEELLLESIEATADDLRAQVEEYIQQNEITPVSPTAIQLVFQHAADHAGLYRIILRGGAASSVLSRIREILSDAALEFFTVRQDQINHLPIINPRVPLDVLMNSFAASMIGVMAWWLEQGTQYSAEQVSEYFRDIFFSGMLDVLGIAADQVSPWQKTEGSG